MHTTATKTTSHTDETPTETGSSAQIANTSPEHAPLWAQTGIPIQTRLMINQPDDPYEQEADRVAAQVMRMSEPQVQRQSEPVKEEKADAIHANPVISPLVQKYTKPVIAPMTLHQDRSDDKAFPILSSMRMHHPETLGVEPLQPKPQIQRPVGGSADVSPELEASIQAARRHGQPLSDRIRSRMEQVFGADFSGVNIHTDAASDRLSRSIHARAFTTGQDIFFRQGEYNPTHRTGQELLAHELTHVVQQHDSDVQGSQMPTREVGHASTAQSPIQKKEDPSEKEAPDERSYVTREVVVTERLSKEEFKEIALQSLFGDSPPSSLEWNGVKDVYGPENSPVRILVDVALIKVQRSQSNAGKGIKTDAKGEVEGARGRAQAFLAGKPTKTKAELMAEIDRRYYEATGITLGEKIKKGETGKIAFWNQIRDEVLFQNEYLQNLPPQVKKLIRTSTNGRKITAQDIDQLFRIAKKIEGMEPAEVLDYFSRINNATKNLSAFEASVDAFIKERVKRKEENEKREEIQTKLYGHEELYKQYKEWKSLQSTHISSMDEFGIPDPNAAYHRDARDRAERNLIAALQQANFSGIADFEQYIANFEKAFEKEAMNIAIDILDKYEGLLYKEGERYKASEVIQGLHKQLSGFRGHYQDFKKHADISNKRAQYDRMPGPIVGKGAPSVTIKESNEGPRSSDRPLYAFITSAIGERPQYNLLKINILNFSGILPYALISH